MTPPRPTPSPLARCRHCDSQIQPTARTWKWRDPAELDALAVHLRDCKDAVAAPNHCKYEATIMALVAEVQRLRWELERVKERVT